MDTTPLREAGLTDGEIKVYLALLELGSSTTGPIVEKSHISRSIIYHILEKLIDKGLASFVIIEKTKYFQASPPAKIMEYVAEREKKLSESKKKIEQFLPRLQQQQLMSPKSQTTMYFGVAGIRTANERQYEKLKKGEEYVCFGIPAYQPEKQHLYWQKDHVRRIRAGITCRLLFNNDTEPEILENRNRFRGAEARYMPPGIKTPALFMVYKDTIVIMLQHPSAIAVEIVSQNIADSFKSYFEGFWKRSRPLRK